MQRIKVPFYLVLQYIKRGRKWTLGLTIFLMAIAFVNLMFIASLLNGIVFASNEQVKKTTSGDIFLTSTRKNGLILDSYLIENKIKNIDGINSVTSRLQIGADIFTQKTGIYTALNIIKPSSYKDVINIHQKIIDGEYLNDDDMGEILIGKQLAGEAKDDEMSVKDLRGIKTGDSVFLKIGEESFKFRVKGVFQTKYSEADSSVFINHKTFSHFFDHGHMVKNSVNSILINMKKNFKEEDLIQKIKSQNFSKIEVHSWKDALGVSKSIKSSFIGINIIMFIVGTIIAATTIFIVIYVDIINKRRQIGIQRALGVKSSIIVTSYVFLSFIYAFFGILLGMILFYSVLVPHFKLHPFELPIADVSLEMSQSEVAIRIAVILVVSIIGGLIPSLLASRMKILDSILGSR